MKQSINPNKTQYKTVMVDGTIGSYNAICPRGECAKRWMDPAENASCWVSIKLCPFCEPKRAKKSGEKETRYEAQVRKQRVY